MSIFVLVLLKMNFYFPAAFKKITNFDFFFMNPIISQIMLFSTIKLLHAINQISQKKHSFN